MLNVLIVDDDRSYATTLSNTLAAAGFDVIKADDVQEANRYIQAGHVDAAMIDIFLDIKWGPEGDQQPLPTGRPLCAKLRALFPHAFILAYSGMVDAKPGWDGEGIKKSVDDLRGTEWLAGLSVEEMRSYLLGGISTKEKEAEQSRPIKFNEDWRTSAAVELVGGPTIRRILQRAVPEGEWDSVRAVSGGYSGAVVLLVSTSKRGDGRQLDTILKLSTDAYPLQAELKGAPPLGSDQSFSAAIPREVSPIPIDGWYAIISAAVREPRTLRDALLTKIADRRLKKIVLRVIKEAVAPGLENTIPLKKDDREEADFRISFRLAAEVKDLLTSLTSMTRWLGREDLTALRRVGQFLEFGISSEWSLTDNATHFSQQHGDLHCRNVLLDKDEEIRLIDFARSRRMPRTVDAAALLVDLWMSVMDEKDGDAWDWSRISAWEQDVWAFFPFRLRDTAFSEPLQRPWQQLAYACETAVLKATPAVTTAEMADSILFQLLRFIRFGNISLPKKLLAVRLSARLLDERHVGR
jgi:CheY-like chemotaxis protein